jgi:3-oxoacyl-[acyl-carrier-protein] synthase III
LIKRLKIKIKETVSNLKKKGISIPIMITMDMRKKLKILGYTLEEIKYLTPTQSNNIIKKSIIKKPGKDRGRNQ